MLSSLLAVVLLAAPLTLPDEVLARFAVQLLTRSGPAQEFEAAAFIVRAVDGTLSLRHWPHDRAFRAAQWLGPIPVGAIAIIHTHPYTSPLPSLQDAREAQRTRLPFYVVSRGALSVVGPNGNIRAARSVPWLQRNAPVHMRWRDVTSSTSSPVLVAENS